MKKLFLFLVTYPSLFFAQYTGTGSVTQGLATTTQNNLFTCSGGRVSNQGSITATDASVWTVPAVVNFSTTTFPFASNLYNECVNAIYANTSVALSNLNSSDIITIDASGEVITAYIFADNYFEMYINGVPVGKDNVPYTQFNSNIIRFRVSRPFSIAMLLVDWEENLGLGSEVNSGYNYFAGDGGMVAIFKDTNGNVIDKTSSDWKAQTFYTAPITNLTCATENGALRLSHTCSTIPTNAGSAYYGLHWSRPINWMEANFDASIFPNASVFTNNTVGVNSKPAYTNFVDVFDDPTNDAQFIWSSNLILDNEIIVHHTVAVANLNDLELIKNSVDLYPNPTKDEFHLSLGGQIKPGDITSVDLYNSFGKRILSINSNFSTISTIGLDSGYYSVIIKIGEQQIIQKLFIY